MTRRPTVFTIGHSNQSLEEFVALLLEHSIRHVVDVRKLPGSTRHPQFDADTLTEQLSDHGIELTRAAGLTGRRKVMVEHIMGPGQLMTAEFSAGAVPHCDGAIVYPHSAATIGA